MASGARYKRAAIVNMRPFEGISVHYWASAVEAKLCAGEEVALVGAGNSAGQAAVFLAPLVRRLTIVVRGEGLEASMSRYLVDRIGMLENVQVLAHSELTELHGEPMGHLHGATLRNQKRRSRARISRFATFSCSSALSRIRRGSTGAWRLMTRATS